MHDDSVKVDFNTKLSSKAFVISLAFFSSKLQRFLNGSELPTTAPQREKVVEGMYSLRPPWRQLLWQSRTLEQREGHQVSDGGLNFLPFNIFRHKS